MVALVLLVLVISYASSVRAWLQQRAEMAAAQADIQRTQASVDVLEQYKQRWNDPAYIQAQARERFGWVLPGEVGYRVVNSEGEPLGLFAQAVPLPDSAEAEQDWYDVVWGSIEFAGTPEPDLAPVPVVPGKRDVIKPPKRHRDERR